MSCFIVLEHLEIVMYNTTLGLLLIAGVGLRASNISIFSPLFVGVSLKTPASLMVVPHLSRLPYGCNTANFKWLPTSVLFHCR